MDNHEQGSVARAQTGVASGEPSLLWWPWWALVVLVGPQLLLQCDQAATWAWFNQKSFGVHQRRWWIASRGVSSSASLEDSGILLKQSFFPSTTQRRCLRVCDLRQHGFVPGTSLRPLKEMLSSTWPATWWEWETGPRLLISYFITLLQYCGWLSSWEWLFVQFWFCKLLRDRSLYSALLHFRMNKRRRCQTAVQELKLWKLYNYSKGTSTTSLYALNAVMLIFFCFSVTKSLLLIQPRAARFAGVINSSGQVALMETKTTP